jgi:hypothetical protein
MTVVMACLFKAFDFVVVGPSPFLHFPISCLAGQSFECLEQVVPVVRPAKRDNRIFKMVLRLV